MLRITIGDYTDPDTGHESTSVSWIDNDIKSGDEYGDYVLVTPRTNNYAKPEILEAITVLMEQRELVKEELSC